MLDATQAPVPTKPSDAPLTVESVLAHNELRFERFSKGRFCTLIQDGTLSHARERECFLACVQLFSRRMQGLFFTRQALCVDPRFYGTFLRHLLEEIGHDELLAKRDGAREIRDAILDSTLCWFLYQMVVLDNVERTAVVHLVLERAGDHAHHLMVPALAGRLNSDFVEVHAELDPEHTAMGIPLLAQQHESIYARLRELVDEAWDVLDAATNRIAELVLAGGRPEAAT